MNFVYKAFYLNITLLLILLLPTYVIGQSEYGGFSSYGIDEGMYHANIKSLCKDSRGFIWVCTTDGLMRYDGVFFDVFRRMKGEEFTLPSNNINTIEEDKYSYSFWLGSATGHISKYNVAEDKFENYYLFPSENNKEGIISIEYFEQIGEDRLLVGTDVEGLFLFSPSKNIFTKLKLNGRENELSACFQNRISNILNDGNYIWVSTSHGLVQMSLEGDVINGDYFPKEEFPSFFNNKGEFLVRSIIQTRDSTFAFFTNNTLYEYNYRTKYLKALLSSKQPLVCQDIVKDRYSNYWLATENQGVCYLDVMNQIVHHHEEIEHNENSLVDNQVTSICYLEDQEIIFIGTSKGLSKYNYKASKFRQYNLDEMGVKNANIFLLAQDAKAGYWLLDKGICYRKRESEAKFKVYDEQKGKRFYAFAEDSLDHFLIATDQGLQIIDLNTEATNLVKFAKDGLPSKEINYINDLLVTEDSVCWLISHKGLIRFNTVTEQYSVFGFPDSLFGNTTFYFSSITISNDKNSIWFASRRGSIYKYDIANTEYSKVLTLVEDASSFTTILDINFDAFNRLWIATYGSGILYYDPNLKVVSEDMALDILESQVYSVVKDIDNNLWVSANKGIAKITPENMEVQYFYKSDGTYCEEFNSNAFYVNNNELLFGGGGRFISFDPREIQLNSFNAPVEICSWQIDDQVNSYEGALYDQVNYSTEDVIEFEQTKSALRIYASVLDFSNPEKNIIKWRLVGFDDNWKTGYTYDPIIYHNLRAGNYTLELKGINSDGYESAKTTELEMKIKAPFVQTIYFKLLLIILVILFIFLVIRFRFSWYKGQENLLTEKVKSKTRELTNTNEELEASRQKIFSQNAELEIHRNYLEELVKARTEDLEAAKLKAEESDKLKTAFLANLSHEIRTPMNAIIGFSSLLQTQEYESDVDKNFLKIIQQSSESLLVLINDIIDISRIETGNIQLLKSEVSIVDLIKEVSNELLFEDKSEGVIYRQSICLSSADSLIYTDPHRLKQILSNLIRNGFKFTEYGYVDLSAKTVYQTDLKEYGFEIKEPADPNKKVLLLQVKDTGIGITEKEIKIIFEPFQKGNNGYKFYKGMGLGLSIVKNLLSILNGDIVVESKVNSGTVFTLYLEYTHEI